MTNKNVKREQSPAQSAPLISKARLLVVRGPKPGIHRPDPVEGPGAGAAREGVEVQQHLQAEARGGLQDLLHCLDRNGHPPRGKKAETQCDRCERHRE